MTVLQRTDLTTSPEGSVCRSGGGRATRPRFEDGAE